MQLTHGPVGLTSALRLVRPAVLLWVAAATLSSQTPPQQVITHEGPLVLRGNQVYTIENAAFIQHGPIAVYDQAQLVVRDSTVEFRQSYHCEFEWRFQDSAQLTVARSRIDSPQGHLVTLYGGSKARVEASTLTQAEANLGDTAVLLLENSSTAGVSITHFGVTPTQFPTLRASGSSIHGLLIRTRGKPTGTVRGLRHRQRLTWTLDELQEVQMNLQLVDTWVSSINWYIGGDARILFEDCDLFQVGPEQDAQNAIVWVRNSCVGMGTIRFGRSHHAVLRGLTSGQTITHWSLHEADPATNVPFDFVIDNSRVDGWYLRVHGDLTVENCDVRRGRLSPEGRNSRSTVRVIRTYVEELFLWGSYGTIDFENSTVGHVDTPDGSTATITGAVRFEQKGVDTANGPWRQATVTRQFPVRVIQTNGQPLAGLSLRLYEPDGKQVWSGQTGPDGQASFEIVFTDANNDKTWSLRFGTTEPPITVPVRFLSDTPLTPPIPLNSSVVNTSALNGKYHFVQLLASAPAGETRTLAGTLDFDGKGGYAYAPEGRRAYWVGGAGDVVLVSPIRSSDWLSAYLSADGDVLTGASTFTADTNYDFFVAVRAPSGNVTNALLNGSYSGAWLEYAPGATPVTRSGLVSLAANGAGQFSRAAVTGHASDQGGRTVNQSASGATFGLQAGGRGTASFGTGASLLAGNREIFASKDGTYLLGHFPARGVLVAAKSAGTGADFEGRYWIAGLLVDAPAWSATSGTLRTLGTGRAVVAERRRLDERTLDHAGLRSYVVNQDGTAALAPSLPKGLANLRLVAPVGPVEAPRAGAFVGAQIGPLNESTAQYGMFFGVRAPAFHPTGVFLDPAGVVNGASFAGPPYPLAPGAIVSLFGSNLATREARATGFPLPTKLDDVTVTANGASAPLYFVSSTQASIQLPYGLTGSWVTLRVSNSRGVSNEVVAPLAATSPGVFSRPDGRPVVLHADYSIISPENPARPGETVLIWLTGLGELSPAVGTGAANPAAPLARAVDAPIQVLFGGVPAAALGYAGGAPGFAGLCQINATIPANSPLGPNVPVAISTSNAHTELVEIPISR